MNIETAIVQKLRPFPEVKRVILFGSRARGDHQPRSDFDVAVDCPQATRERWMDFVLAIQSIPTLLSIQLIRYNTAPTELQERIQEEGISLYEQSQSNSSLNQPGKSAPTP